MAISSLAEETDPFLWLEEVRGEKALAWVAERNEHSSKILARSSEFKALNTRIKAILDAKNRIPYISKLGDYYYNFWRDEKNERGILRRTSLTEYRKPNPQWEIVLDIDQLGEKEGESWVYKGSSTLQPSYDRSLIRLSKGGSDAVVVREFDFATHEFVEGGFILDEAKSDVAWLNRDELLIATDFGDGTLTESGYARIVKRWHRGKPIEEANTLYEGNTTDVAVSAFSDQTTGFERAGVIRAIDFYNSETYLLDGDALVLIDKPTHADVSFFRDWMLISPKKDWVIDGSTYPAGSLLVANLDDYLQGNRNIHVLFKPTASRSLAYYTTTRNFILLNVLENVRNRVDAVTFQEGDWRHREFSANDGFQTISVQAVDRNEGDQFFLTRSDFLTPPTLAFGEVGKSVETLKHEPYAFKSQDLIISQHWATSKDGTKIPYFQVGPKDVNEPGPTLLYGYGGFEVSMMPSYQKVTGAAWLEAGGTYVVANIRGGGEFGPEWHRAALKENRHKAFEDFIAVAEDLVSRDITTPKLLGTMGGSNGGLLMGNMLTRRPDLFGAIVASVPLFDMQRYHLLLAGASWMAEYGDPDMSEEWAFIKTFSPFHNLDRATDYPALFVTTSTADDRVHPGHARKLVARMLEFEKDVVYHENLEGGHAGAADNTQQAYASAMEFAFLWTNLSEANESGDTAKD